MDKSKIDRSMYQKAKVEASEKAYRSSGFHYAGRCMDPSEKE